MTLDVVWVVRLPRLRLLLDMRLLNLWLLDLMLLGLRVLRLQLLDLNGLRLGLLNLRMLSVRLLSACRRKSNRWCEPIRSKVGLMVLLLWMRMIWE